MTSIMDNLKLAVLRTTIKDLKEDAKFYRRKNFHLRKEIESLKKEIRSLRRKKLMYLSKRALNEKIRLLEMELEALRRTK